MKKLQILPIGDIDPVILETLSRDLNELLQFPGITIKILDPIRLLQNSYNPQREQYLCDDFLRKVKGETDGLVLGVTDVDFYTYNLNFVFGQAELPGRAAVISIYRLHSNVEKRFHHRILKEAVHELGHTFGLRHCPDTQCVMHFSNSIEDTDIKSETYCIRCVELLQI